MPLLGVGGMQLFMVEMNGINYDKLHPRTMHTAKRLWGIYIFFTLLETLLLYFGDMDWFDALCHSLTTISSGGFSTRTGSLAGFSDYSQIVVMCFMILSGCNFTLLLIAMVRRPKALFYNEEFKNFIFTILGVSIVLASVLIFMVKQPVGSALRASFFSVISTLTTTGFFVNNYTLWPVGLWCVLLVLMFIGACSGSTAGGIKIIRHQSFVVSNINRNSFINYVICFFYITRIIRS